MSLIPQVSTPSRRTCMLMVTHACNLNCTYCYERFKDDGMMSFETAKDCILKEADFVKSSDKYKELEIDFMGGEPLMNFNLIKQVVEWLESVDLGVPFIAFATSNGTLITEEMKPWLEAHRKTFVIGLSYDGDETMQACNRGTRPLDLNWFAQTWPFQGVRMTVSKATLQSLAKGVLSLQSQGVMCSAVLAQGVDWDDADAQIFESELRKLAEAYLLDGSLRPVEPLLTRSLEGIGEKRPQRRFCGSGTGMITYDINGRIYPCHMFTPLVLGQEKTIEITDSEYCGAEVIQDPDCEGCDYACWCPTCYGFNQFLRGDVSCRDHGWCKMIDVQVRLSCEFQVRYYHQHLDQLGVEDAEHVHAAVRVARMFKSGKIKVKTIQRGVTR